MSKQMLGASPDTDNKARYALTCNIIRDFCEDAIASGRLPSDAEIHGCAYPYEVVEDGHEDTPLTMKPTEAARLAGVSVRTITRMCYEGQLPAVKLRDSWRINRAAFMGLLEGGSR